MGLKEQILEIWNGNESIRSIVNKLGSTDENTIRVIFNRLVELGEIEEMPERDENNFKLYVRVSDTIASKFKDLMKMLEAFVEHEGINIPASILLRIEGKSYENNPEINLPQKIKDNFEWFARVPPACGKNFDDGTIICPGRIRITIFQDEVAGWMLSGASTGRSFRRKPRAFNDIFVNYTRHHN